MAVSLRIGGIILTDEIYLNKTFKRLRNTSAQEIRASRTDSSPIRMFKIGLDLSVRESLSWLFQLNKLSSTLHKNNLVRTVHGEIYTKEKLFRFGMVDSPKCPRCDLVETLQHKIYECTYVSRIWNRVFQVTHRTLADDPIKNILAIPSTDLRDLTIHAEIIQRILYLKEDQEYLLHPKAFVELGIKDLIMKEGKADLKTKIKDLLNQL